MSSGIQSMDWRQVTQLGDSNMNQKAKSVETQVKPAAKISVASGNSESNADAQTPVVNQVQSISLANSDRVEAIKQDLIDHLNLNVNMATNVSFEVNGDGHVTIIVAEKETGETIREIPPEEVAKLAEKLQELRGLLVEMKV